MRSLNWASIDARANTPDFELAATLRESPYLDGYSKPRTVTTREEVAALPEGSVILDSAGDVAQLRHGLWCSYETAAMTHNRMAKYTPAKVLHEPEPTK